MEALPPVPCPPSQRWREIRIRFMPLVAFVGVLSVVVFIWKEHVAPPTMVGEVYAYRSSVSHYQPGTVQALLVSPFQSVTNGQPIAEITLSDPEFLKAIKELSEANNAFIEIGKEPLIAESRMSVNVSQLEAEYHRFRVDLAIAKTKEEQAKRELKRERLLWEQGVSPAKDFELAESAQKTLSAEIAALEASVNSIEKDLAPFKSLKVTTPEREHAIISSAKDQARRETDVLLAEKGRVILRSTVDGVVSLVNKRPGESFMAGEPLVMVTAVDSDHILAYVRQPITILPQKNQEVEVRSRSRVGPRQYAKAKIQFVGSQMEPITPTIMTALTKGTTTNELGLAVRIEMPRKFKAVPGEIVDIHLSKVN